ncbi:hypothetical protein U0070_016016 [Myodes glareolus]|uniref:Uncharacterized protein n=1 Tax=Myodes glareolus TaxID=447135 RepID=A0AAW0I9I8_MYOGA
MTTKAHPKPAAPEPGTAGVEPPDFHFGRVHEPPPPPIREQPAATAQAIKGMHIRKATKYLKDVTLKKQCVPFRRYNDRDDPSSVPSSYTQQLTATCNSAPGDLARSAGLHRLMCSEVPLVLGQICMSYDYINGL